MTTVSFLFCHTSYSKNCRITTIKAEINQEKNQKILAAGFSRPHHSSTTPTLSWLPTEGSVQNPFDSPAYFFGNRVKTKLLYHIFAPQFRSFLGRYHATTMKSFDWHSAVHCTSTRELTSFQWIFERIQTNKVNPVFELTKNIIQ